MLKLLLEEEAYGKLSDEIKALYKKGGDGKWHLETDEDAGTATKLKEFRDNNIKLMKEKEELEKQIAKYGTEPEKVAEMKKRLQEIEDKKMIAAGEIDKLVEQKTERMRQDFENQIKAMKTSMEEKDTILLKTNERLSEVLIDSEITKAVTAVGGVRKDAMQDIISRGKRIWKLEDGKPIPKEGDRILYGKDGKEQLTFDEWAKILVETAPFLFDPSSGGGAGGAGGAGVGKTNINNREALSKLPAQERLKALHATSAGSGASAK